MIVLGLTGSIGMGKSTTADFFRERGVPVWDADAAVHKLYARNGAAVEPVAALCPDAVTHGKINREVLRDWVSRNDKSLNKLENIVHPLVREDRSRFIDQHRRHGTPLVVLDIPLLFETGADTLCDATLTVSIDPVEQQRRVLARPGMSSEDFRQLNERQMPDAEKRRRANHVIETHNKKQTRDEVVKLIEKLLSNQG